MDRPSDELPFQTRIQENALDLGAEDSVVPGTSANDGEWSLDELEAAYQRALDAADSVTTEAETVAGEPSDEVPQSAVAAEVPPAGESGPEHGSPGAQLSEAPAATDLSVEKVIEALLFVGGDPVSGRRLADLLGGEQFHDDVDETIAQIDDRYREQGRPYHVQLVEGGYRLSLLPGFEPVRSRVYGLGPKDVRLSQDALEILALVAYRQPISRSDIEATGKTNAATMTRQLLRLELIALERGDGGKDDIRYHTTERFLELFSLNRLEDLPHPEDLMFR